MVSKVEIMESNLYEKNKIITLFAGLNVYGMLFTSTISVHLIVRCILRFSLNQTRDAIRTNLR